MEEKNSSQEQIAYDPNQIVELRTEWHDLEIPTEPVQGESAEAGDETGEGTKSGNVTRAGSSISEIKTCQETLRQVAKDALSDFPADHLSVAPNFEFTAEGPATPVQTDGDMDSSVVPSHPVDEAIPTATFRDLKGSLGDMGDRIQDLLANLDLQIEYEKTDKGARVRVHNQSGGARSTDEAATSREPDVREIKHQVAGGGTVTVSVKPRGPVLSTADGDTGSAANNNTIGYINKRTKGLIVNEFGQLYSVINLGLTLTFQFGFERD